MGRGFFLKNPHSFSRHNHKENGRGVSAPPTGGYFSKQGFVELYTQRVIEGNIVRLKLSRQRPHRLRHSRLGFP